jgi:hypothetical protein
VNYACFNVFQPVRFFADIDDSFDLYVSSAQQSDGLLATGFSLRICALRAEVEFVTSPTTSRN